MKIRNGFVSNSSSSSFVLMTSQEYWDEVKGELEPFEVAVAESLITEPRSFCGISIVSFATWSSHSADWTDCADVKFDGNLGQYSDYSEPIYTAWLAVLTRLKQDTSKIHTGSTSF